MLKDRQEILAVGELAVFLLAWTLCVFVAFSDHSNRTNPKAKNALAESSSPSPGLDFAQ